MQQSSHSKKPVGKIVRVAVPAPLYACFDYLPPEAVDERTLPPGSRVRVPFGRRSQIGVVLGHADSTETNPDVVSRVRAENVKAYLVDERGVEDSRVSVRGAGSGRAVDSGASKDALAKNRRVEVIFLPAGARPPEFN